LAKKPLNISSEDARFISDQMLQHKINEYNRIFKTLRDVPDPRVKAVLVAEHFAGRLGTKDYKKFRQALRDTNYNLEQAYRIGVFQNPKLNKDSVYTNAAKNLLTWFNEGRSNVVEKPLPKPPQVKPKTKEKALPKPKPEGFIKKDSYGYPMTDQGFRA
jgi:hypothetical protein